MPNHTIRWPDGSAQPLTDELGHVLVLIAQVFPGAKVEGCRPSVRQHHSERPDHHPASDARRKERQWVPPGTLPLFGGDGT